MRRTLFLSAMLAGGSAVGPAYAAPSVTCPTATVTYYMTTVTSCFQGSVKLLDFKMMVDLLGSSATDHILVVPLSNPTPTPGGFGRTEVGFDFVSVGRVSIPTAGQFDLSVEFRILGKLTARPFLHTSWRTSPWLDPVSDPFYDVAEAIFAVYAAGGCLLVSDRVERWGPSEVVPGRPGVDGGLTAYLREHEYTGFNPVIGPYCDAVAPVQVGAQYRVTSGYGVHPDWQFDRLSVRYDVFVTPEPAAGTLAATGLALLAIAGRLARRRR